MINNQLTKSSIWEASEINEHDVRNLVYSINKVKILELLEDTLRNTVGLNIRFYQHGDEENIVRLLKKTFPKWNNFNNPLELWRWKYIDTPCKSIIVVALMDDKIVGCNPSLILNAKIGSELTTLHYGDDLVVDPEYRGLGLWGKMRDYKSEYYPNAAKYYFSSTTNPIVKKSWVERNRSFLPFTVTRMIRTQDINQLFEEYPVDNKQLVKLGYISLSKINKITNFIKPPIQPKSNFQINQIIEFDKSIDDFWGNIKNDYNFIIEKKHPYLNWRFQDNDRGIHARFMAADGGVVLGYVVVEYKPGSGEGQVVDLLALSGRLDVASALLERCCEFLGGLGIKNVFYQVILGHPYQKLSERHGFIDTRSRPDIVFDYTTTWKETLEDSDIPFIKNTTPSQVYFNYSTTL